MSSIWLRPVPKGLRGLYRQLERLILAAKDYRTSALAETPELLRIAQAAYKGSESSCWNCSMPIAAPWILKSMP